MSAYLPDSDSEDELPPGWEERVTADNNVYYVNHNTKGTQWNHPRTGKKKKVTGELPVGWDRVVEGNKILFIDHANERVTYADPRLAFAKEIKDSPMDLRQRFDSFTTALQVLHGIDLSCRVAIITGANTGLGYETARSLALHGCTVVMACRSVESAEDAASKIRAEKHDAKLDPMFIDLQRLSTIDEFAAKFMSKYPRLDLLIMNAGVFALPHSLTPDGLETVFQVNYLSHALLALRLEDVLTRSAPARVIFVSSESHRFSSVTSLEKMNRDYICPSSSKGYFSLMAYNHSKLLQVLFSGKLARVWANKGIACHSLHPGNMISSGLPRYWWPYRILFAFVRPFTKSLQQGASTIVYCATASDLDKMTGVYFNNCFPCEPSKAALDTQLMYKLWNLTRDILIESGYKVDMPNN